MSELLTKVLVDKSARSKSARKTAAATMSVGVYAAW